MAIITLQRRMMEIGRIRMGVKDGNRPKKIETFRFTSQSERIIQSVASLYGGTVRPWKADPKGPGQFEVITDASAIDIVVAPGQVLSQFYEMWSGGGCARRCDGETELLSDAPCVCPSDEEERRTLAQSGKACKPTSRFNCMVRDVEAIGLWRLESHGVYAAVELAGMAELLEYATQRGIYIPATLRSEQRTSKRNGQTFRYAVPVVEVHASFAQVWEALGGVGPQALQSGATLVSVPALPVSAGSDDVPALPAASRNFTPVPTESLSAVPQQSIREQVEQPPKPKTARANAAAPIPTTGRKPRPAFPEFAINQEEPEEAVVVDDSPDRPLKLVPAPPPNQPVDPFEGLPGCDDPAPKLGALKVSSNRGQQLAMGAKRNGIDEEMKHDLIGWATSGRTTSGNDVTDEEAGKLHLLFSEIKRGRKVVSYDEEGRLVVS